MAWTVDNSWLQQHSSDGQLSILDPRPPVKYLQGHIPGAINLPVSKLFTPTLQLRTFEQLATILGGAGATLETPVLVYDSFDGQNGALLAWALELLGHQQVLLLSKFFESWAKAGHPLAYRPVKTEPKPLQARLNLRIRATSDEISRGSVKLLDLRSQDEFEGKAGEGSKPHLPGAISLPWTSLLGSEDRILQSGPELERVFSSKEVSRDETVITYCSFGPRAAIGYFALKQANYDNVKLYDGASQYSAGQPVGSADNCVATSWNLKQS